MNYPYGQPGYGYPPPTYGYQQQPGGGSAITAAVFALILGLVGAVGVVVGLVGVISAKNEANSDHGFGPSAPEVPDFLFGLVALGAIAAFLWLLGAILLFRRSPAGRVILIIMSALSLVGLGISAATANLASLHLSCPRSPTVRRLLTVSPLLRMARRRPTVSPRRRRTVSPRPITNRHNIPTSDGYRRPVRRITMSASRVSSASHRPHQLVFGDRGDREWVGGGGPEAV
jgi:hypothetical protein